MSDRYFLDTNVFVYSFERSSPAKARRATDLIHQAITTGMGIVSYQVVQEFFNVALKRFEIPLTPAEAEQYLAVVFRPLLAVHSSQGLFVEAIRLKDRYRLGWYDSLILAGAIEARCTVLYSEDFQDGLEAGGLRVVNPFAGRRGALP
jgi:predicted nucleic acid-binding protein